MGMAVVMVVIVVVVIMMVMVIMIMAMVVNGAVYYSIFGGNSSIFVMSMVMVVAFIFA